MDLTKALDFLEKQGLADCHYQDSGMMEHIAENMQKYADQQLILSGVGNCPFEAYAVFCIECDRQGMKPIKYKDYLNLGWCQLICVWLVA